MTIYIFDTSVLITNPSAYKDFHNANVIIPIAVLDELDKLKKLPNEAGKNARVAVRRLDEISQHAPDLSLGITLDNDIHLSIDTTTHPITGDALYGDVRILACAKSHHKQEDVIVVSNDLNMRVRARAMGMLAERYDKNVAPNDLYSGVQYIEDNDAAGALLSKHTIKPSDYDLTLNANECIIFRDNGMDIAKGRKTSKDSIRIIKKATPWDLEGRNAEQELAIDLLLDPRIPLITFVGNAGTGKSLISLACGLEMVLNKRIYERMIIYRPTVDVDDGIGWLPGPQPLDAKILTPDGWTTMGEVKPGSKVITKDGRAADVLEIFPKGIKSVYKVITTEGTSTECCEDHLWLTQTAENKKRQKPGSIKSTRQIIDTLLTKKGKPNHFLPRNAPVHFNESKLPLAPYTLGVLLGDGHIGDSISIANQDNEIVERVAREISVFGCRLYNNGKDITYSITSDVYNHKPARKVQIINKRTNETQIYSSIGLAAKAFTSVKRNTLSARCRTNYTNSDYAFSFLECPIRWTNPIRNILYNLGLDGKKAWNKFIPDQYKYQSSIEDRLALLQGLMDTYGTVKINGETSFCTTSKQLALDIIEIVRSLGGKSFLYKERNRIGKETFIGKQKITSRRISYEFDISFDNGINPFYLKRKAERYGKKYIHKIGITSIEYVGKKEVQCILIDDPQHLYITDDFIVTHNSLEEKLSPWMQPINDNLEVLMSKGEGKAKSTLEMYEKKGKIQMDALSFIRGRSIPNSFILFDEAQNCSMSQIKTVLTRVGEGSKVVLTGDISQIDNKNLDPMNNGLSYVIEKFKGHLLSGHLTLTKGERSPLATAAAELL